MAARFPWLATTWVLAVAAVILLGPVAQRFPELLPGCPFKALTGIPCATCGLTRCLVAVSAGHWQEAFRWHPAAWVVLVASPLAVCWDLWRTCKGLRYPALPDHWLPRAAAAAALLAMWALQIWRGM